MDDCRSIRRLIPWYLTGQLDAEDVAAVDAHLETCDACCADLAEAARVRAAVNAERADVGELERIWERIAARLEPQSTRIDVGSFLLGLSFGVTSGQRGDTVHGSLRVLGRDVQILGRRRKGA